MRNYIKKPREEWLPRSIRSTKCKGCGEQLALDRPPGRGSYCIPCFRAKENRRAREKNIERREATGGRTREEYYQYLRDKPKKVKPPKPTSIALAIPKTKKHCRQCRCLMNRTGGNHRLCPNCKARNLALRKRIKGQKRRARKKTIGGTVKVADLRYWANVQGGICYLCGKPMGEDVTTDHVVPLAKGGTHQRSNIRLAHHFCNSVKSDGPVPQGALFGASGLV